MSAIEPVSRPYIGRFAPSPTGDLHFGSLVAAVGSYLRARSQNGRWLLRIEDIDPPREVAGAAARQIATLTNFGLLPDAPVSYQSASNLQHQQALAKLLNDNEAFRCACARRDLPDDGSYPGTCRNGLPPGREARSVRLRTDRAPAECFDDVVQGRHCDHPGRLSGDFILWRSDGLVAYQLAVVVDDAAAGITEIVRGADLLDSTARQLLIYRRLGLPVPDWMHLPVVTDANGRKLSKSDRDDPIVRLAPRLALRLALRALGHEPPVGALSLEALWQWARSSFDVRAIPRGPVAVGEQAR